MNKRKILAGPAAMLALGIVSAAPAFAQQSMTFTIVEVGADVVGTASGAFDLTGLSSPSSANLSTLIQDISPGILLITGSGSVDIYNTTMSYNVAASSQASPSAFFTAFATASGTSSSGSVAGIYDDPGLSQIVTPAGYTTGTSLTGTGTWAGATLAGLNLNPGTYVWNYGPNNSSITIQVVAASAVPEPGEWAAIGVLGAGLTGLVLRKRKKA